MKGVMGEEKNSDGCESGKLKREERVLSTQNRVCCDLFLIFLA